ncbi:restriction endonuclease subunit S [Microbacterium profundi]|uniref:restriction endonuclease subunit S n=1 Tax=Microbacterium profundi TaxID=450380 RepID=UPI00068BFFC8|nr:restriction endonuclease subunit S [Microbacterium profundi]
MNRGLVGGPFGSSLVSSDYADDGIPVIRGTNMGCGRYVGGEFAYVSTDKFDRDLSRNVASARDIVFTQRGTLGQVALVPESRHNVYVISQSQMRLRVDPEKASPEFVYYAATSPDFLRQIDDRAISTGVPHTNLGILAELEVPDLPLLEQQAIAEVLGALDDKIAANTRLAATTEQMLRAEIDLRWLNHADRSARLSDFVELNPTTRLPATGDEPAYIDMRKLPEAGWSIAGVERRAAKGGARFKNGDTLLARITPCLENRKTGYVDVLSDDEVAVGSTEFIVLRARDGIAQPISFLLATESRFREHAIQHMVGTSGRQRVAANDLNDFALPTPDVSWLQDFGTRASATFAAVQANSTENRTLAATRDALLPQLMSGQLRVTDVDRFVDAATATPLETTDKDRS